MLVILGNSVHLNPFLLQKGFFFLSKRIISRTLSSAKIFYENAVSLYLIGGFENDYCGWSVHLVTEIGRHHLAGSNIGKCACSQQRRYRFVFSHYLTNRFRVAVGLFSNRSQMTSKCSTRAAGECVTGVFTTFWRHLWSITEQTHGIRESLIQWSEKKIDRYTYLPRIAWLFEDLC